MPQIPKPKVTQTENWALFLVGAVALGLLAAAICAGLSRPGAGFGVGFSRVFAALLTAGAAMFVGGFLGFLFGIPMSQTKAGDDAATDKFRQNTNLEQISDWLTKIIIGVTLVEFKAIFGALWAFAEKIGPAFLPRFAPWFNENAGNDQVAALAMAFLLFFGICGFLFGYLWSRVQLISLFNDIGKQVREQIAKQLQDWRLLEEVEDYLAGETSPTMTRMDDLLRRIREANRPTRTNIFFRARRHRLDNRPKYDDWKPENRLDPEKAKKSMKMELAIPIFEALNAADPGLFHRNYAQIGFAYKDMAQPKHAAAEPLFRKAIELRDPKLSNDHSTYELSLAECLIVVDAIAENVRHGEEIETLVTNARSDQNLEGWPVVGAWMTNRLTAKMAET